MILWLTTWYPDEDAPGRAPFVKHHFDAVREAGVDAQLLFVDVRYAPRLLKMSWQEMREGEYRLRVESMFWKFIYHMPALMAPWIRKAWMRQVGILPASVHAHVVFPAGVLAHKLASHWNISYGITEHWSKSSAFLRKPWLGRLAQRAYQRARFVAPVSEHLAESLRQNVPSLDQIQVVPNVITVAGRKEALMPAKCQTVNVMGVASLIEANSHIKRVDVLLRALALLKQRHPNVEWRYRHFGGGAREVALKSLADALGVSVQWEGSQPPETVRQAYLEADLMLHLTTSETFGMVVYEAMLSGIPVLTSDIDAFQLMVPSDCRVSIDADEVADRIESFWHQPARRGDLQPEQFSAATVGEQIRKLYS